MEEAEEMEQTLLDSQSMCIRGTGLWVDDPTFEEARSALGVTFMVVRNWCSRFMFALPLRLPE